jgi:hypothetical protein
MPIKISELTELSVIDGTVVVPVIEETEEFAIIVDKSNPMVAMKQARDFVKAVNKRTVEKIA